MISGKKAFKLSAVLIGLATIIFISLPQFYRSRIASIREECDGLELSQADEFSNIRSCEAAFDDALVLRNHAEILGILGKENLAKRTERECINALQTATVAVAPEKYQFENTVKKLASYEELFPFYLKFMIERYNGIREMRIKSIELKGDARRLEKIRSRWWLVGLALQSLGIIFSVVSSFSEKKGSADESKTGSANES